MITINPKPISETKLFTGEIELDEVYHFTVQKNIQCADCRPYEVVEIHHSEGYQITEGYELIKGAIINYCNKNGL